MTNTQTAALAKLTKEYISAASIDVKAQTLEALVKKGLARKQRTYSCGYTYVKYARR